MNVGVTGSTDRVIVRLGRRGVYGSFRLWRARGFWFAYGPGYTNRAGLRP